MAEYMDDVLQPRSRHSWDVLKAWFKVGPNVIGNGVTEQSSKPAPAPEEPAEEGQVVGSSEADATDAAVAGEQRTEEASDDDGKVKREGQEAQQGTVVSPAPAAAGAAASAPAPAAAAETEAAATPAPAASVDAVAAAADVAVADGKSVAHAADSGKGKEDACEPAKEPPPPSSSSSPAAAAPDLELGDKAAGDRKEASSGDCSGDGDDPMGVGQEPQSDSDVGARAGASISESSSVGGGDVATAGDSSCGSGWTVVESTVRADGTCENCGEVLRSIDLSLDDEQRLLKQVGSV